MTCIAVRHSSDRKQCMQNAYENYNSWHSHDGLLHLLSHIIISFIYLRFCFKSYPEMTFAQQINRAQEAVSNWPLPAFILAPVLTLLEFVYNFIYQFDKSIPNTESRINQQVSKLTIIMVWRIKAFLSTACNLLYLP